MELVKEILLFNPKEVNSVNYMKRERCWSSTFLPQNKKNNELGYLEGPTKSNRLIPSHIGSTSS